MQLTYDLTSTFDTLSVLTLLAYDPFNSPSTMKITVNVNISPIVNSSVTTLRTTFIVQQPSYLEIDGGLFIDEAVSSLVFNAEYVNGSALPSWLTFTPPVSPPSGVFNFSGSYPTYVDDELHILITAVDQDNLSTSQNITIFIDATCHAT